MRTFFVISTNVIYFTTASFFLCNLNKKHFPQYFSAALADSEHRIMLAEDAIGVNKTRARLGPPDIEPSYAHRSFR